MSTHADIAAGNSASQEALRALVARLSDADLARDLGGGWTVATMLAHTAFFDVRVLVLFRHWATGGEMTQSPFDVDVLNEAMLPFFQQLPARAAAELAVAKAAACDAAVAALTPEQLGRMEAAGYPARLDRAHHRLEHIAQIKQVLR